MTFIMNNIVNITLLVVLLTIAIYYLITNRKKTAKDLPYDIEIMQKEYLKNKKNPFAINLKNKLELSWKFLYDITEYVIAKFSNEDKDIAHTHGLKLYAAGMRYEHVVDLGIKYGKQASKEQTKDQGKEIQR